jgi:hypothetical protein
LYGYDRERFDDATTLNDTMRDDATHDATHDALMFRLFITERKGNIHWNVPSRVETSKAALKKSAPRLRAERSMLFPKN